ncbi:hypothetical protein [Rhizobium sp. G21]|uniref:hypothetical protein n=1 Tax=Rhizobium sp. G21 TaxID=2758439 RepID=UPI0015FFC2BC|nr:hypothetical protein [Rhizobium sp. G21]MBB1250397.1 hypothetical protein [Rhizobium sp. G21]
MVLAISLTCADVRADDRREGANLPALFDRPMTFAIVRSGAGYCEPVCPEWIYGEGRISPGTPAAFKKIVKKRATGACP